MRVRAGVAGLAALVMTSALAVAPSAAAQTARTESAASGPCAKANSGAVRFPVGLGGHVVFAVASGYGSSYATVTECARKAGRWHQILSTPGRIGSKGYAPVGEKREGDGRSPSGSYSMNLAFGEGDPGTALHYHKLLASNECWGSTVGTPEYNRYFHGTCRDTDEDLVKTEQEGQYRQFAVINYNRPPDSPIIPGDGSAIFLHINGAGSTAGCVSVSEANVKFILRTLHPGDRIVMGTQAAVFG